jgi:L-aminopeptidase/D-esterase-like protein
MRALAIARFGALAADCLTRAVARGVYAARGVGAHRGWGEMG